MGDFDDLLGDPEDDDAFGADAFGADAMIFSMSADAGVPGEGDPTIHPPLFGAGAAEVETALREGTVVALPAVGGYCLAVQAGLPGAEERLATLAADPDGPHYAVGHVDEVRALTSGWSDEVERLLERCWPGPVDVFLPRAAGAADEEADEADAAAGESEQGGWAVTVGMPDGRALRRLCKEHGPWRTIPLNFNEAAEVARAFDVNDVALVVDGGRREGATPTLVDATVSPVRVLREGALPANFVDAAMAMSVRKRWFGRRREAR
jgi:tRNA A37 threonylcarbamoyladenosine synthetase subunit TsaC/SUA5/YrdC